LSDRSWVQQIPLHFSSTSPASTKANGKPEKTGSRNRSRQHHANRGEIDFSTRNDPLLSAPPTGQSHRRAWTGDRHILLYQQLRSYAELWKPAYWIVDATGVGAGLADFVSNIQIGIVIPFTFTSASKSKLGWDFLGIVETGRFKNYKSKPTRPSNRGERLEACQMTVIPDQQLIKWGVPGGTSENKKPIR
jgi:hypothetical protein